MYSTPVNNSQQQHQGTPLPRSMKPSLRQTSSLATALLSRQQATQDPHKRARALFPITAGVHSQDPPEANSQSTDSQRSIGSISEATRKSDPPLASSPIAHEDSKENDTISLASHTESTKSALDEYVVVKFQDDTKKKFERVLEEMTAKAKIAMDKQLGDLRAELTETKSELTEAKSELSKLKTEARAETSKLKDDVGLLEGTIRESKKNQDEALAEVIAELRSEAEDQKEAIFRQMEEHKGNVLDDIGEQKEVTFRQVGERKEAVLDQIEDRKEIILVQIEERKSTAVDRIEEQQERIHEEIEEQKDSTINQFDEHKGVILDEIHGQKGALREEIATRQRGACNEIEKHAEKEAKSIATIAGNIVEKQAEAVRRVDQLFTDFETTQFQKLKDKMVEECIPLMMKRVDCLVEASLHTFSSVVSSIPKIPSSIPSFFTVQQDPCATPISKITRSVILTQESASSVTEQEEAIIPVARKFAEKKKTILTKNSSSAASEQEEAAIPVLHKVAENQKASLSGKKKKGAKRKKEGVSISSQPSRKSRRLRGIPALSRASTQSLYGCTTAVVHAPEKNVGAESNESNEGTATSKQNGVAGANAMNDGGLLANKNANREDQHESKREEAIDTESSKFEECAPKRDKAISLSIAGVLKKDYKVDTGNAVSITSTSTTKSRSSGADGLRYFPKTPTRHSTVAAEKILNPPKVVRPQKGNKRPCVTPPPSKQRLTFKPERINVSPSPPKDELRPSSGSKKAEHSRCRDKPKHKVSAMKSKKAPTKANKPLVQKKSVVSDVYSWATPKRKGPAKTYGGLSSRNRTPKNRNTFSSRAPLAGMNQIRRKKKQKAINGFDAVASVEDNFDFSF